MLCARQISEIESHWEEISNMVINRLRTDHTSRILDTFPEIVIRHRVEDLLSRLGHWLTRADQREVEQRYQDLGWQRAQDGVPLFEIARMVQVIRECAVDYAAQNDWHDHAFAGYAQSELEHRIARFFDAVLIHIIQGYERYLRASRIAGARKRSQGSLNDSADLTIAPFPG